MEDNQKIPIEFSELQSPQYQAGAKAQANPIDKLSSVTPAGNPSFEEEKSEESHGYLGY